MYFFILNNLSSSFFFVFVCGQLEMECVSTTLLYTLSRRHRTLQDALTCNGTGNSRALSDCKGLPRVSSAASRGVSNKAHSYMTAHEAQQPGVGVGGPSSLRGPCPPASLAGGAGAGVGIGACGSSASSAAAGMASTKGDVTGAGSEAGAAGGVTVRE